MNRFNLGRPRLVMVLATAVLVDLAAAYAFVAVVSAVSED